MSVEAIIGVLTAVVALFSAAVTLPCWAPLFSTDATRTTELLKGKKETLRLLIKDLKPKKNGVFIKQVSDLIADSDAFLDQLDNSKISELEEKTEQKCICGLVPHLCIQKQARSEMDEQLIPKLKTLILKAESIISKGNPCRGYRQSREVAINGRRRSETKEKIWEAVSLPEKPKVICIHGALGVGKTAMAKCIHNRALNDENEELFRYVVWVDVECGSDVYRVQEFIAKSLDISLDDSSGTVERASKLENALLVMDNFLLVLDSMWKPMSLKEIGIPELREKRKVIVTSRISTICDQMGDIANKFEMQPLVKEEEAWELFQMAGIRLLQEDVISGIIKPALMAELDGLPLAIIKFALALGNTHGEQVKSSDVHDKFGKKPFYLQGTDQELLNHFNGSYLDLDENLRPCFMYCALFPKGHVINAKELIEYWMWEGLLGDFETLKDGVMEGKKTLQELQNRHLLQWASGDHEKVKMLSLFRTMAIETMAKEGNIVCIRSGGHLTSLPSSGRDWNSKVERASFMNNKLKVLDMKDIKNCSRLLTLLLQDNPLNSNHLNNGDFFSNMCNLRVIDMSRTKITNLPISISKLEKLCALILRGCSNLKVLPNLSKLQQLLVLDVSGSPLEHCPPGIERLKRLRRLDFSHTRLASFPNKAVVHLTELEELLMITESGCLWGSTEDNQGTACIEDLFKLKRLVVVQLHLRNTQALNKYLSYVEDYTHMPPRFCFLVGDVHRGRGSYVEENNLTISGIDAYIPSSNSELNVAILRSLRELNVLDVSNLSGLTYLFSVEILKCLTKLRELRVTSCGDMAELVKGATQTLSLPKLTRVLLFDLPSLKSLCCGQVLHCPELRFIEVWECQNLKFPMIKSDHTTSGSNPLLKIHVKGERSWWSGKLEWDNNGIQVLGFGVSPHSHSNFTFTEANVPPELTPRRTTRLNQLDSQAEEANVVIQTNNTSFERVIGTFGFGIGWAQSNLIGTNQRIGWLRRDNPSNSNSLIQDTPQSNEPEASTSRAESDVPQEEEQDQGSSSIINVHQTNAISAIRLLKNLNKHDYLNLLSKT